MRDDIAAAQNGSAEDKLNTYKQYMALNDASLRDTLLTPVLSDDTATADQKEEARRLLDESDPNQGSFNFSVSSPNSSDFADGDNVNFSVRIDPDPINTKTAYKLFTVDANGNPHALFIDNANALELGTWYDADSPSIKDLDKLPVNKTYLVEKNGKATPVEFQNKNQSPSKEDLDDAAKNGARYIYVGTDKRKGKFFGHRTYHNWGLNGSGTVAKFAMRPGWHATNVPSARHIGAVGESGKIEYRRPNQRWFLIEMAADKDYNDEAKKNQTGDIPDHIPTDGWYGFQTNTNANKEQDWYISGAIRIVRPLTESETHKIANDMGYEADLPYKDGVKNFNEDLQKKQDSDGLLNTIRNLIRGVVSEEKLDPHAVRQMLADSFNINQADKEVKPYLEKIINLIDSFLRSDYPAGSKTKLTGSSFRGVVANTLGFDFSGTGSAYLTRGNQTIRIADHSGDAENFNTDDNIGIIIQENPRKMGESNVKRYVEYIFKEWYLNEHPELIPGILFDIGMYFKTGEYHDRTGAVTHKITGPHSFRIKEEAKIAQDRKDLERIDNEIESEKNLIKPSVTPQMDVEYLDAVSKEIEIAKAEKVRRQAELSKEIDNAQQK